MPSSQSYVIASVIISISESGLQVVCSFSVFVGRFLIDRKDLKFEKQLGKGNFGEVWKAKYKGNTDVAVKMTLPNLVNNYDFIAEAKLMM